MRNKLILSFLLVSLFFSFNSLLIAEELSLDECETEAIKNSSILKASGQKILLSKFKHDESASNRLPKVFAGGSYKYVSEVAEIEIPFPGFSPIEMGVNNSYEAKVGVAAPLYTGGQLNHLRKADFHSYLASQQDFKADSLRILYWTRQAWFYSSGLEAELETLNLGRQRLKRHHDEIDLAINNGMASIENRIQIELEISKVDEAITLLEGQLAASRLQLGKVVGKTGDAISAEGDLSRSLINNSPLQMQRPELSSLSESISRNSELEKSASGSLLPQVSANTAFIYGKPGVNAIDNEWMGYAVLGVEFSWTIWDFGTRKNRVHQAQSAVSILEHNKTELEDQLNNNKNKADVNLQQAKTALDIANKRIELEKQRQQMLNNRYQNGNATETELLDGEDDLRQAEINTQKALTRLRLAEVELLYTLGK